MEVFTPTGPTVTGTASTSSGVVALGSLSSQGGGTIRIAVPSGGSTVFVEFGTSGTTASTSTSMPVFSGAIEVFQVAPNITHAAVIVASGTQTIYFTPGQGA